MSPIIFATFAACSADTMVGEGVSTVPELSGLSIANNGINQLRDKRTNPWIV